ncbi:protein Jade-1 isoform X2 [Esox lucius]|uniref:protein Jade-1 isoform X2 n=1 Tax=Esox lucius TaxID=8010 RepID=UPI0014772B40|nr:protein Jade-1 isoform X2 [Esox lucius]
MKRSRHPSSSEDSDHGSNSTSWSQHSQPRRANGKKPSEVFRTDFITAMKLHDTYQLNPEDYCVLVDPWRQEWEKGVQVPVSPDTIPQPVARIMAEKGTEVMFSRPKKLIRSGGSESLGYVAIQTLAEGTCRYDLNETDVAWLELVNHQFTQMGMDLLNEATMERVMEEFERRCYDGMSHAMATEEGLGIEYDEDVVCDVCRSPDSEDNNEMVFCDKCNICVHQACYGILKVPEGSWLCRPCALGITPKCHLCPKKGGAMKPTRSGTKWVHVSCALWIPEVSIGNPEKMEPITNMSQIPSNRWALTCCLCKDVTGACIQCSAKSCRTAFHVSCALQSSLEMNTILTEQDEVKFKAFCPEHSGLEGGEEEPEGDRHKKGKRRGRVRGDEVAPLHTPTTSPGPVPDSQGQSRMNQDVNLRQVKLQQLEEEFYQFVDVTEVANHLQYSPETVDFLYQYWKLKRRANHNQPLLTPQKEEEDSLARREHDVLLRRLQLFTHLRQDLERVRNLTYMVTRREKIKRTLWRVQEQIFTRHVLLLDQEMITGVSSTGCLNDSVSLSLVSSPGTVWGFSGLKTRKRDRGRGGHRRGVLHLPHYLNEGATQTKLKAESSDTDRHTKLKTKSREKDRHPKVKTEAKEKERHNKMNTDRDGDSSTRLVANEGEGLTQPGSGAEVGRTRLGGIEGEVRTRLGASEGEGCTQLGVKEGEGLIRLGNSEGEGRTRLGASEGEGCTQLGLGEGHTRLGVKEGEGLIRLGNSEGVGRTRLGASEGEGRTRLGASEGEGRTRLGASEGEGRTRLGASEGEGRTRLGASEGEGRTRLGASEGEGRTRLGASEGEGRTRLGASEGEGRTRLGFKEAEGRTRLGASEGEGRTRLGVKEGEVRTRLGNSEGEGRTRRGASEGEARTRLGASEGEARTRRGVKEGEVRTQLGASEGEGRTRLGASEGVGHTRLGASEGEGRTRLGGRRSLREPGPGSTFPDPGQPENRTGIEEKPGTEVKKMRDRGSGVECSSVKTKNRLKFRKSEKAANMVRVTDHVTSATIKVSDRVTSARVKVSNHVTSTTVKVTEVTDAIAKVSDHVTEARAKVSNHVTDAIAKVSDHVTEARAKVSDHVTDARVKVSDHVTDARVKAIDHVTGGKPTNRMSEARVRLTRVKVHNVSDARVRLTRVKVSDHLTEVKDRKERPSSKDDSQSAPGDTPVSMTTKPNGWLSSGPTVSHLKNWGKFRIPKRKESHKEESSHPYGPPRKPPNAPNRRPLHKTPPNTSEPSYPRTRLRTGTETDGYISPKSKALPTGPGMEVCLKRCHTHKLSDGAYGSDIIHQGVLAS